MIDREATVIDITDADEESWSNFENIEDYVIEPETSEDAITITGYRYI